MQQACACVVCPTRHSDVQLSAPTHRSASLRALLVNGPAVSLTVNLERLLALAGCHVTARARAEAVSAALRVGCPHCRWGAVGLRHVVPASAGPLVAAGAGDGHGHWAGNPAG